VKQFNDAYLSDVFIELLCMYSMYVGYTFYTNNSDFIEKIKTAGLSLIVVEIKNDVENDFTVIKNDQDIYLYLGYIQTYMSRLKYVVILDKLYRRLIKFIIKTDENEIDDTSANSDTTNYIDTLYLYLKTSKYTKNVSSIEYIFEVNDNPEKVVIQKYMLFITTLSSLSSDIDKIIASSEERIKKIQGLSLAQNAVQQIENASNVLGEPKKPQISGSKLNLGFNAKEQKDNLDILFNKFYLISIVLHF